jgi:hypothetical protein
MNQFVNPKKRSIQLPPGCKDLIDVLRPLARKVWAPRVEGGTLMDVRRCVNQLFAASEVNVQLCIGSPQGNDHMVLHREGTGFSGVVPMRGREQERLGEAFFSRRSIKPTNDEVIGPADGFIKHPDMPTRVMVVPLPAVASDTVELVVALLREVYGVSEESRLEFLYVEPYQAP